MGLINNLAEIFKAFSFLGYNNKENWEELIVGGRLRSPSINKKR